MRITGVSKTYTGATLSPQTERTKKYAREQLQIGRSRARVMVAYFAPCAGRLQPRLSEAQLFHRGTGCGG